MRVSRRALLRSAAAGYAGGRLLTGLAPFSSARAEAPPAGPAWLKDVFRELHIDAHFGQVENPYANFDAEQSAEILKNARFQMVSYFASCGAGYSYYPTGIGVPHPSLKRDFTGEMTKALKKRGIRVLPYVSVGPDRRFHQEHPDWISVRDPSKPTPETRNGAAQMCINSPWVDEAHIPQLKEIVSLYDVDGFFLDSLLGKFTRGPCYCKYCRAAFAREVGGEIPVSDSDPNVFAVHRWLSGNVARYADRVTSALAAVKPDLAFVFTHVWVSRNPVKPPASVTQLVWEPAPPYPGVHSLDFSMEARYLSTQPGIVNWSCMATRGNGWGDYSLRDPAAFQHEAAVLLASSGRPYLSDDSYPSGNPDAAVYQVYGDVNRRTEELEAIVKGAAPVKDIAVLLSAHSIWSSLPLVPPREWLGGPSSPAGCRRPHRAGGDPRAFRHPEQREPCPGPGRIQSADPRGPVHPRRRRVRSDPPLRARRRRVDCHRRDGNQGRAQQAAEPISPSPTCWASSIAARLRSGARFCGPARRWRPSASRGWMYK